MFKIGATFIDKENTLQYNILHVFFWEEDHVQRFFTMDETCGPITIILNKNKELKYESDWAPSDN